MEPQILKHGTRLQDQGPPTQLLERLGLFSQRGGLVDAVDIGNPHGKVESFRTLPNFITTARTAACIVIFSVAAYTQDMRLNVLGLIVFWGLDSLDGYLARRLDQETVVGAQLDILSDRILIAYFYLNYLSIASGPILIVSAFLLNFMVLDHFLSNQYLRWSIISPNYFYKVDRVVWALNWSTLGKFANGGVITIMLLLSDNTLGPLIFLAGIFTIKAYSFYRLSRLPPPPRVALGAVQAALQS